MFKKTADLVGYGTPKVDEVVVRSCLTQMSQRLHVSRVALSMPKVKVTPVSQSVSHFRKSVQMAETGPKHLSPRSFLDVLGPFPGHVSGGDERAGANCIEGNDGETMYLTAP